MKSLNIGCGEEVFACCDTIDINPNFEPTFCFDINDRRWPIHSNTYDMIYAHYILEHTYNLVKVMEEIYRIAKPNAIIHIKVPHYSGRGAWINPTHYRAFALGQFDYFDKDIKEHYGNCNFKAMSKEIHIIRQEVNHHPQVKALAKCLDKLFYRFPNISERICCYWFGGFSEIEIELKVIK